MCKKKVLILALDGFTWRIGKRLTGEGQMPVLAGLLAQGSHGNLKSVIPSETSPAWSSFQTGCHPDKTGVFAFHGFLRQTRNIKLNSFQEIKIPTIWELLSVAGKKVVSINMPMTSPPPQINGIIIPGLTCPKLSSETVHPPEIFDKYIAHNPDYLIVNNEHQPDLCSSVTQAIKTETARCCLALQLMREIEWDLFSVQIQSTDVFQHRNWWAVDPDAEGFTEEAHSQAIEFYKSIDSILGKLIGAAGQSVLTVILSDHGFCAKKAEIGINTWLSQNGYLSLNDVRKNTPFQSFKETMKDTVPLVRQLARAYGKVKGLFSASSSGQREKKSAIYSEKVVKHIRETIDLDRTFAFCLGGMAGLLYLIDRTQKGKAASIIRELLDAYGPESREPLISDIQPIENFCQNADENYPDYIIGFLPGIEGRIGPESSSIVNLGVIDGKQSGTHEQNGIYLLNGQNIKTNFLCNADIVDITPTLLAYLGIAIPDHMDGKVLIDVFENAPSIQQQKTPFDKYESADYSGEEQSDVEKRLADLGYL